MLKHFQRTVTQLSQVEIFHYFCSSERLLNLRPGDGNIYPTELRSKISQSSLSGLLRLKCIREVMIIVYMTTTCAKKLQRFLGIFKSVVVVVDEAAESTDRFILSVPIPVSSCQI